MSPAAPIDEIAARARAKHSKWSESSWETFIRGSALSAATGLDNCSWPSEGKESVLRSLLELTSDGIGLGYLTFTPATNPGFLRLLWESIIPSGISALESPERALEILAQSWNLTENLSLGPCWAERLFMRKHNQLTSLAGLSDFVKLVDSSLTTAPVGALPSPLLSAALTMRWIDLRKLNSIALPGDVSFISTNLLQISDRFNPWSYLVLFEPEPLLLAQIEGGNSAEGPTPDSAAKVLGSLTLGELHATAVNSHYLAAVPILSQRICAGWAAQ